MSNVVTLRQANLRATPLRRPNAELRTREHLTETEVERLIEAAKANRHGHRDATMILIAFRHGLRASELSTCAGTRSTSSADLARPQGQDAARRPRTR